MSNVRSLNTEVHARKAVAHLKHRVASCFAVNASKRPYRKPKVAGVVQSCNARAVAWAARPLAVGLLPVVYGTNWNTGKSSAVYSHRFGPAVPEMHFKFGPRRLVALSERQSAVTHRQCLPRGPKQHLARPRSQLTGQRCFAALRRYRSAKVRAKVLAPASTPAQSSACALRLPECAMHPSQASNPSIERTFQRPLRALWPAAHVER